MEIDSARAVLVEVANEVLDLFFGGFKPEGAQGYLELLAFNRARPAGVEEVECLLNLLFLVLAQFLLGSLLLFVVFLSGFACLGTVSHET